MNSPSPTSLFDGHTRREYYTPVLDLNVILRVVVRERLEKPLGSGAMALNELQRLLDKQEEPGNQGDRSQSPHLRRRLQQLRQWHRKASKVSLALVRLTG
ncbi:MAG TPA: hypothetical protein VGA56_02935 [Opitutaceae bacterium]